MTNLLIHPYTGMQAIGTRRDGRPIWPVKGGDGTTPPPTVNPPATPPTVPPAEPPAAPPADPPKDDIPAGDKRAILADLAKERDKRQALERRFEALATALGDGDSAKGKSDVDLLNERFAEHEKTVADERQARWRAEVAHEKGLTPAQAARLTGATREELTADADALVALFPGAKPGTPAPDPSQGSRGGQPPDTDALIREAQANGNWREVLRLQNQKLATK